VAAPATAPARRRLTRPCPSGVRACARRYGEDDGTNGWHGRHGRHGRRRLR
jgi:hypothetical protein